LINEIFRIAKLFGANVGLDTQIIAYRSQASYASFSMPSPQHSGVQSDVGIIQENLKSALWQALERSGLPNHLFERAVQNIVAGLRRLQEYRQKQEDSSVRFIRYWLVPTTGEWSMADLEPNVALTS
jgi:hypothetical protein